MIKLRHIINEVDIAPEQIAQPIFKEFAKYTGYTLPFTYLGLNNKQYVFTAPIQQIGMLDMLITKAEVVALITEQKSYFGITYLLNGLEQFDATVCMIRKADSGYTIKAFDNNDSDFTDAKTDFIGIIKRGNG